MRKMEIGQRRPSGLLEARIAGIGVTDSSLSSLAPLGRYDAEPAAVPKAAEIPEAEGVLINIGRTTDGTLPLADSRRQEEYRRQFAAINQTGRRFVAPVVCADVFHTLNLANKADQDKAKEKALEVHAIGTQLQDIGVELVRLPFFGKAAITSENEDAIVGMMQEVASEVKSSNVVFGLETTLSPEDNLRIRECIDRPNVFIEYDGGNLYKFGFDPVQAAKDFSSEKATKVADLKDNAADPKSGVNANLLRNARYPVDQVIKAFIDNGFDGWFMDETIIPGFDKEVPLTHAIQEGVDAGKRENVQFIYEAVLLAARGEVFSPQKKL